MLQSYSLIDVVTYSAESIVTCKGYIPPSENTTDNTVTKVLLALKNSDLVDIMYQQFADEIVYFFKTMEKHPDYKDICNRNDAPEFMTCMEIAKSEEVTEFSLPFAVLMVHLYSKLNPKQPKILNPLKTEAKILSPGQFMGTLNYPERFFVKLVYVGKEDNNKTSLFKVVDRSGNVAFFQDKISKYESLIYLNDCFAIHATPSRHTSTKDNEKHTIFRTVELLKDTIITGTSSDQTFDETTGKKFCAGRF